MNENPGSFNTHLASISYQNGIVHLMSIKTKTNFTRYDHKFDNKDRGLCDSLLAPRANIPSIPA